MQAEHQPTGRGGRRPEPLADPGGEAAALARQAVSLVVGGCASTVAVRSLRQRAGASGRPALEQAALRLRHADELGRRVRRAAVALLTWAAVGTTPVRHDPPRPGGTIRSR